MEIRELLKKQEQLDAEIMKKFYDYGHIISTNELLNDRLLALFTEVGEFANELGSFKYWKHYKVQDDKKIKEEFADILFFFLSIGNLLEYTAEDIEKAYMEKWEKNMERQRQGY
jgi:dimeric dUTPase (all-alpha-NTP-PPase superfamily)